MFPVSRRIVTIVQLLGSTCTIIRVYVGLIFSNNVLQRIEGSKHQMPALPYIVCQFLMYCLSS